MAETIYHIRVDDTSYCDAPDVPDPDEWEEAGFPRREYPKCTYRDVLACELAADRLSVLMPDHQVFFTAGPCGGSYYNEPYLE
jgi:hypothetical protein